MEKENEMKEETEKKEEGKGEGRQKVDMDYFSMVKMIGEGSYSSVFLVKKKSNKKMYAIKKILKKRLDS